MPAKPREERDTPQFGTNKPVKASFWPWLEPFFRQTSLKAVKCSLLDRQRLGGGRVRGGLVFKAHRWLYHSTLGSRVIKKKKKKGGGHACEAQAGERHPAVEHRLRGNWFVLVYVVYLVIYDSG